MSWICKNLNNSWKDKAKIRFPLKKHWMGEELWHIKHLLKSIIRLWWRSGMWGMPVDFSHLCDNHAQTLDSLILFLPAPGPPQNLIHFSFPPHIWFKYIKTFVHHLLHAAHLWHFLKRDKKKKSDTAEEIKRTHPGDHHSCAEWERHLLSRMVGLFLWRIFLNFPLKSLGGNGSRGKLAMRPRTTSSRTSEQSVSLSAMSLTALSSKDVSDGREPTATSIILPSETVPVSPSFLKKKKKCAV